MAPQDISIWHAFENAVAGFYRELGARSVRQNVDLAGNQVDVFVEEETASGQIVRCIVECKYYQKAVPKDVVVRFGTVAQFLRQAGLIDKAVMVAYKGYTRSASLAAEAAGVELLTFQDLEAKLGGFPRWSPEIKFSKFGAEVRTRIERVVEEAEAKKLPDEFPQTVFVAMPFNEELEDVYIYGIRRCVEEVGLSCVRADEVEHGGPIVQEIQDQIQRCRIIIAEVSDHNPNVFYEVGWAHALERPTILLAREGTDLPFDIRHVNTIMYKNIHSLEERLLKRLQAFLE